MKMTDISERFKNFAEWECKGSSELYEYLSRKIAEDNEMLELSSFAQDGQPIPNLFLGSVHYLLQKKGNEHKLSNYYRSMVEHPCEVNESFKFFKNFCETYRAEIISILKEKIVQTNEVRRCAYLYPTFSYIYNKMNRPLALIEIGTSAGFQLLWDKYSYSYHTGESYGSIGSNVEIKSNLKGDKTPFFLPDIPPVSHRFGLDLHINDVTNSEDFLWLNSLIWPEHKERRELFEQAVKCITQFKSELSFIEGDGVELLSQIVNQIPQNAVICIFHTHVANQIPDIGKHMLLNTVRETGQKRDVFHIYNNMWDRDLHLDSFINKIEQNEWIAETDGHGRWFSWKL